MVACIIFFKQTESVDPNFFLFMFESPTDQPTYFCGFIEVRGAPDPKFDDVYSSQLDMRNGRLNWKKIYPLNDPSPPEIFWHDIPWGVSIWIIAANDGYMFPVGDFDTSIPPSNATWTYYETGKLTPSATVAVTVQCSRKFFVISNPYTVLCKEPFFKGSFEKSSQKRSGCLKNSVQTQGYTLVKKS